MTLRIDDEVGEMLTVAASVLDTTVSDCVRDAVDAWLVERKHDRRFIQQYRASVDRTSEFFGITK